MKSLIRFAATIGVAALFAGCSGSQLPIGAAANSEAHTFAHRGSSSSQPLLYAFGSYGSGDGMILEYPSGKRVTEFHPKPDTGVTCSDSEGNVYLGGQGYTTGDPAISEYQYGATSPKEYVDLTSQGQGSVRGCSADPTTGNIAALVRADDAYEDAVAVFAPGLQGTPQIFAAPSMDNVLSVTYDGNGNLFLLGVTGPHSNEFDFDELPKGGSSFEAISLNLGSHRPTRIWAYEEIRWATNWDGQYVTIDGAYTPEPKGKLKTWKQAIYRLTISGSAATVAQTIFLKQPRYELYATYSFTPALNSIVETDNAVRELGYPSGKSIDKLKLGGPSYSATIAFPQSP